MKEYRLAVISSIVVGVCCGILLAVILLFMMLQNNFVLFNMSFWISLIVVVAIPFCLLVVKASAGPFTVKPMDSRVAKRAASDA